MKKITLFIFLIALVHCKKQGEIHFPNGDSYTGAISNHKPHGKGKLIFSEGIYIGDFAEGKRSGNGIQTWNKGLHEGEEYIGEWKDDEKSGSGIHTWPDGRKYNGVWSKNRQNGKGVLTNAKGDSYNGNFLDDLAEGEGIETKADGTIVHKGSWLKGKPVK